MAEGGLPLAALQIVTRDGKTARVARVYVDPRYRRQGLAAALLAHARTQFETVEHSDDLSPAGAAWRLAVGEEADRESGPPRQSRGMLRP
jgi:GNAT superfamily N-acetyltransferase